MFYEAPERKRVLVCASDHLAPAADCRVTGWPWMDWSATEPSSSLEVWSLLQQWKRAGYCMLTLPTVAASLSLHRHHMPRRQYPSSEQSGGEGLL